jgi:hypothetical protein
MVTITEFQLPSSAGGQVALPYTSATCFGFQRIALASASTGQAYLSPITQNGPEL